MSLLDEWNKVKKNENNAEARKWALNQGSPAQAKRPDGLPGGYFANAGRLNDDIVNKAVAEHTASGPNDYGFSGGGNTGNGTRQGNDDIPASVYRDGPGPMSLMDQLIEAISQQYQAPQRPDFSQQIAGYKKTMDDALAAKLAGFGGIRNTAQSNYDTSDRNLMEMFGANAANIASQGSQRYNQITADQKAGLTQSRDSSINALQADRQKQIAERQAMLQALGIQGVGAAEDPTVNTLNNSIDTITRRSDTNLGMADQMGASNQAYNQSVVNSVNQQGTERRAALMQQLQGIFGKLDMAEADARSQNEQAKAQMEMQMNQAIASAPDNSYEIFRDRQGNMMDLYKTLMDQQMQREKLDASGGVEAAKVQGFSGLAQDLLNNGVDPNTASQYIGVLSNVLGSEYMQGISPDEGYDRASIIARRLKENGVPDVIAGQLATNYANLGNNASFTAQ